MQFGNTGMVGTAVIPTMGSEADSAGARASAVRCKARRTDASSTPGRTIDRNGTDDEDFEDSGKTESGSGQRAAERILRAREADEWQLGAAHAGDESCFPAVSIDKGPSMAMPSDASLQLLMMSV